MMKESVWASGIGKKKHRWKVRAGGHSRWLAAAVHCSAECGLWAGSAPGAWIGGSRLRGAHLALLWCLGALHTGKEYGKADARCLDFDPINHCVFGNSNCYPGWVFGIDPHKHHSQREILLAFHTDYSLCVWIVWWVDDLLPGLAYVKPQP